MARNKAVFFPAAWARYADARPGKLGLVLPEARLLELEQDYRKMNEMIFGEPPTFRHLLEVLREIESQVNWESCSIPYLTSEMGPEMDMQEDAARFYQRTSCLLFSGLAEKKPFPPKTAPWVRDGFGRKRTAG